MDWSTNGERLNNWARHLVIVSCLASVATSILYILFAFMPITYFKGYISGYYSLYDYRVYYSYSGQPIAMPHTDYSRHVIAVFSMASYALAGLAILSAVLSRFRPFVAPGIAYGVSSALVVLYGLLRGYIWRAVELDMARFGHVIGDTLVYTTLAGAITFEGARVEHTAIYELVLLSPVPVILLAVATISSAIAAGIAVYTFYKQATEQGRPGIGVQARSPRGIVAYLVIGLTTFALLASVFTYYPTSVAVAPQPPPATLEAPPYPYTCTALTRTARGALAYTDFETYPLPGWATSGGMWSSVGGVAGAKGNVLQGADNDRGLGQASHYYYNTDLSARTSLWIATKMRWVSGSGWYGISMMNSGRSRLYEISINREVLGIRVTWYLEIWTYNVDTTSWNRHARVTISGYSATAWYTLVVYYTVSGTTISITAYLYDVNGNYVTSVSATISHANVFIPAYIGVTVDEPTAYFDEFIISTSDPRSIYFTGFSPGMVVEVWDNLGYLVNSTAAPASSFHLNVRSDIVVGTGSDGRFVVRYPDSFLCLEYKVPVSDAILGGDSYSLATRSITASLGVNKTSAGVAIYIPGSSVFSASARLLRVNAYQTLYARLILDSVSAPSTLDLDLWLEGVARSTSITIRSGLPISTSTSIVQLNLGLNNHVALSGYFTAAGQTAILNLRLEFCTALGGMGACVYYPIVLEVRSP